MTPRTTGIAVSALLHLPLLLLWQTHAASPVPPAPPTLTLGMFSEVTVTTRPSQPTPPTPAKPSTKPTPPRPAPPLLPHTATPPQTEAAAAPKSSPVARQEPAETAAAATPAATTPQHTTASDNYLAALLRAIEANKTYPHAARRLGIEGCAHVAFTLHRDGRITDITIRHSSGDQRLDAAALDAIASIRTFDPIPDSLAHSAWTLAVDIDFALR